MRKHKTVQVIPFLSWLWDIVTDQYCILCEQSSFPQIQFKGVCRHCYRQLNHETLCISLKGLNQELLTCGYFEGSLEVLLKSLKFNNRKVVADILGYIFFKKWGEWCLSQGIEIIIPVPASRQSIYQRGYNQVELIAQSISKRTKQRVENNWLKRVHQKKSQKECTQAERFFNVDNCFKVNGNKELRYQKKEPIYQTALLIDDVVTTGATISEAKRVLEFEGIVKNCFLASVAFTPCVTDPSSL